MAINSILDIGRQGMQANQKAMETTSNNIANANTEGYSRRRAQFEEEATANIGGVRTSRGVNAKQAMRYHDKFVENQILSESRGFGTSKARREVLARVEDVVSHGDFRMGDVVNDFFNRVRELAANPEQGALRMGVMQAAEHTADSFKEMNRSLTNIQFDVDRDLEVRVDQINRLTRNLADLNASIARFSSRGDAPHDLLDQRDLIMRDLSQKLGIQASTDDQNQKFIALEGAGVLVAGDRAHEIVAVRTPAQGGKGEGTVELFLRDDDGLHNIRGALDDGELAGVLEVRDNVIGKTIEYLDRAAYHFAKRVNEVHSEGVGNDGYYGDKVFQVSEEDGASQALTVNKHLLENPSLLAVGYDPEAPSDNRIALAIADLQNEEMVPQSPITPGQTNGAQTLNDGLNIMIGEVGIHMEEANHAFDHQRGILDQLNQYRESVAGVNLEEEAINMAQYQTVYNASAKALKVGTELFATILEIV